MQIFDAKMALEKCQAFKRQIVITLEYGARAPDKSETVAEEIELSLASVVMCSPKSMASPTALWKCM
jgi:hypothetical protein